MAFSLPCRAEFESAETEFLLSRIRERPCLLETLRDSPSDDFRADSEGWTQEGWAAWELRAPEGREPDEPESVEPEIDFDDFDFPGEDDQTYPYLEQWGHFQLQFDDSRHGARGSAVPIRSGLGPEPAIDNLYFRRFRPTLRYHFDEKHFLEFKTNIEPEIQRVFIMDLMLGYRIGTNSTLLVGRQKTPFGFEGFQSSRFIHTAERSEVTFYVYPERDLGVSVMREVDGTEIHAGVFLGQPRSTGDTTGRADFIGRVNTPINEQLRAGLSLHSGAYRPTALGETLPVRRVGVEAQCENGPWKLEGEAIASWGFNQASQADTPAFGYYLTAVRRLHDKLDLVLSYDQFNPDRSAVDWAFPNYATNARQRAILGLNYYFSRDPAHRILFNYEVKQTLEGPQLDRSGVRLRYQFAW